MPPRLQLPQDIEQVIRLGVGQRRGRLVEHENLALEGERPRDLQQLPMRGRAADSARRPDSMAR